MNHHLNVVVLGALAIAMPWSHAASAIPPCNEINFDEQLPNTVIGGANQPYASVLGVTFNHFCQGNGAFVATTSPSSAMHPPSPQNALSSPLGDPLQDCCVTINWNMPQSWVRLQVAAYVYPANTPQQALTIFACDWWGLPVAPPQTATLVQSTGTSISPTLSWATAQFDLGPGNCSIAQVKVCNAGGAFMSQFFIDNVAWGDDTTAPIVYFDSPAQDDCLCGNLYVDGSICDPDGCGGVTAELFIREYVPGQSSGSAAPFVSLGSIPAPNCTSVSGLFSVPLSGYPSGRYMVRLEGTNACGLDTSVEHIVIVDRNAPVVIVDCPQNGAIVNGQLDIRGSINDLCLDRWRITFSTQGLFPWVIVSGYSNVSPVIACIDTVTAPPDGPVRLTVAAGDRCGGFTAVVRDVIVDNTKPVAIITDPAECLITCQEIAAPIMGIIDDAHLAGWILEYKIGGSQAWTPITSGTNTVGNSATGTPGVIAHWYQCQLPNCCYVLRLRAWDKAGGCAPGTCQNGIGPNSEEFQMCANLGLLGDLNGDGVVNGADFSIILSGPSMCPICP